MIGQGGMLGRGDSLFHASQEDCHALRREERIVVGGWRGWVMFRAAVENEAGDEDERHTLAETTEGAPPVEQHAQLPPQEEGSEREHEGRREEETENGNDLMESCNCVHDDSFGVVVDGHAETLRRRDFRGARTLCASAALRVFHGHAETRRRGDFRGARTLCASAALRDEVLTG